MNTTIRTILVSASVLAAFGVATGAFGAHALADAISPSRLETFGTGSRYLLVHAVALLAVGSLMLRFSHPLLRVGALMLLTGSIVFSGSLFILVLLDLPVMGAITPIGGVLLIGGWLALAVALFKAVKQEPS